MRVRAPRKSARGQRIQRGGAAQGDEPAGRHGEHIGEGGRREVLRRGAADDQHGDGLQRVLQRVGEDDGEGGAEEEEEFVEDVERFVGREG